MLNFSAMEQETKKQILDILSRDSRMSHGKIASMLAVSEEAVREAVLDLEKDRIIKKYNVTIDWQKAGVEKVVAFVDVNVTPAREVGFEAVAMRIARYPQVRGAWLISGGSDLRLLVETDSINQLAAFVAEDLATIDGVTGTNTNFHLRKYKEEYCLYDEPEADERLVVSP